MRSLELPDGDDGTAAPECPGAPAFPFRYRLSCCWLLMALVVVAGCSILHEDLPNEAPVLQASTIDTTRVSRGGAIKLEVLASDEDDDQLTYTWRSLGAGSFSDTTTRDTKWYAPVHIQGSSEFFLLTVTISDRQPDTEDVLEAFRVEVVQHPPTLLASGDTTLSFREPGTVLWASAADEDGDALSFEWEMLAGPRADLFTEEIEPGESRAQLIPLFPGDIVLKVAATDGSDTVSAQISVQVQAAPMPEDGMVSLALPLDGGGVHSYEIDVYEYPNQKGVTPVVVESWFVAAGLCAREGKRLCASSEWEFACRGPEGSSYSSSDDPEGFGAEFGRRFCNSTGSEVAGPEPGPEDLAASGSFPNCSSSTGVYDLTGNVREWLGEIRTGEGRIGRFVFSSVESPVECGGISSELYPVPFADEFDVEDQAQIDSLMLNLQYATYGLSGMGFRCCR